MPFPFFRKRLPREITFLELHSYQGLCYRVTGQRTGKHTSYSIGIIGRRGVPEAVILGFTEEYDTADRFARYLLDTATPPEHLAEAAALFFSGARVPSP